MNANLGSLETQIVLIIHFSKRYWCSLVTMFPPPNFNKRRNVLCVPKTEARLAQTKPSSRNDLPKSRVSKNETFFQIIISNYTLASFKPRLSVALLLGQSNYSIWTNHFLTWSILKNENSEDFWIILTTMTIGKSILVKSIIWCSISAEIFAKGIFSTK